MPWNSVSPCRQQNISKKMDDPFNIAEFKEDTIKTLHTLPRDIELYGIKYMQACWIHHGFDRFYRSLRWGHMLWKGGEFYYNGMLPESSRLVPLNKNIHFSNKEGSNAIYLLSVE